MVAGGCIIVMEIIYNMDFSLAGFLICCIILGFGTFTNIILVLSSLLVNISSFMYLSHFQYKFYLFSELFGMEG